MKPRLPSLLLRRAIPASLPLIVGWALLTSGVCASADWLDFLGLRKGSRGSAGLSTDEITAGLKEALSRGITHAVTNLGRADGFLKDPEVRIPLPQGLQSAERTLRSLGQGQLADEFMATINHAAEKAVPEAAAVLTDSLRQMTLTDARQILSATNQAATEYFRRNCQTNLFNRFLPVVKEATEQTGVTSAYKRVLDKAGLGGSGAFGGLARSLFGGSDLDLDAYITTKSLDGLFLKMAEEEQRIRDKPSARATELLQKVFGSPSKR